MQRAGRSRALVRHRTHFSHPVMIKHCRARPRALDALPSGGNAAAALARNDDDPQPAPGQVHTLLSCDLPQVLRVGGSATEHGDAVIDDGLQPGQAVHRASWEAKTAKSKHRVECRPKTNEWA